MFTVIFHDEAEKEFTALPAAIRAKWPATHEAGSKPSPATRARYQAAWKRPFRNTYNGADIARGIWVYQSGERIFLLRIFIKNRQKCPRQK